MVTGAALERYNQLGGAAGSLGYPVSDGTGSGPPLFQHGALAANQARLVTGAILAKWKALNYEEGPAGLPTADATAMVASTGNKAQEQTFAKGTFFAETSGPHAGQAQLVSGLILDRYMAIGGASGAVGLAGSDACCRGWRAPEEVVVGYVRYAPWVSEVSVHGA